MSNQLRSPTQMTEDRLQALAQWGVDLSLTRRMLALPPAERVAGTLETADRFAEGRRRHLLPRLLRRSRHPLPPHRLFQSLVASEADWVLVGRLAEIAGGAPLVADQVEICFRPDEQNAARLAAALLPLHPRKRAGTRLERTPHTFVHQSTRLLLEEAPLTLETEAAQIVLQHQLPGVGDFSVILAAARPLELYGCRMEVLTLPALLARRQARGLAEDDLFIPQLEAAWLLSTKAAAPAVPASGR